MGWNYWWEKFRIEQTECMNGQMDGQDKEIKVGWMDRSKIWNATTEEKYKCK